MRQIFQSPAFARQKKKLTKKQITELDDEVRKLAASPDSGEQKKGDLAGIYVYKCRLTNQLYLIAYEFDDNNLRLIFIAPHENFYRDLKNSL